MDPIYPKPKLIQRVVPYIKHRWKELTVSLGFAMAAGLMVYTLMVQGVVMGIKIPRLKVSGLEDIYYSPLTGSEVAQDLAQRPVTGIMIENLFGEARPQSSLSQAGVVFEAVAEGGITRYLALYQEARPGVIGPVRSLRPYYLDWAQGFDARIIHAGGSADAMSLITQRNAKSMNCLVFSASCYRTGDKAAPHNLYSSFDKIDPVGAQLGYNSSSFTPFSRVGRKKEKAAEVPTNTTITLDFSGPQYTSQFRYDQPSNSYLRFNGGAPDVDRENNQQIAVKNLVVIPMLTSYDGKYAVMNSIASGEAIVFRDGIAIKGTWSKDAPTSQIKLIGAEGADIQLNRGPTWFAIVPADRTINY